MQDLLLYNWNSDSSDLKGRELIVKRPTEAESFIDSVLQKASYEH